MERSGFDEDFATDIEVHLEQYRQDAVLLGGGTGNEPLPDFFLKHENEPRKKGAVIQKEKQHLGRNIVRKICGRRPLPSVAGPEQFRQIGPENVCLNNFYVAGSMELPCQQRRQLPVHLDRQDISPIGSQKPGQRPPSRPHFQNSRLGIPLHQTGDPFKDIPVGEEVLPQRLLRPDFLGHDTLLTIPARLSRGQTGRASKPSPLVMP